MPYIKQYVRDSLKRGLSPRDVGELNYIITKLCNDFIGKKSYARLNEVIGVLECAKLEFYRRAVAPYEDEKIAENGDVYPS